MTVGAVRFADEEFQSGDFIRCQDLIGRLIIVIDTASTY